MRLVFLAPLMMLALTATRAPAGVEAPGARCNEQTAYYNAKGRKLGAIRYLCPTNGASVQWEDLDQGAVFTVELIPPDLMEVRESNTEFGLARRRSSTRWNIAILDGTFKVRGSVRFTRPLRWDVFCGQRRVGHTIGPSGPAAGLMLLAGRLTC